MDIAVIIPTYNRAHVLRRALDTVFAQALPPDEVIVVDDGSTDDTAEWVAREYSRAHLIRQENRGVSAARNAGIGHASADWIALLDSDDEWRPQKLERQAEAITQDEHYHRICHTDEIWIRNGSRVNQMDKHTKAGGWIFNQCLPLCAISPSSVLIHREVFGTVGLFDEDLPVCEDYDLWLRICSRYPVLFVDEPLVVKYGGHEDQLSKKHWGMDRFRIQALEKILEAGELTESDFTAARQMLIGKLGIYVDGARKRGKNAEVERYEAKRRRWMGVKD